MDSKEIVGGRWDVSDVEQKMSTEHADKCGVDLKTFKASRLDALRTYASWRRGDGSSRALLEDRKGRSGASPTRCLRRR